MTTLLKTPSDTKDDGTLRTFNTGATRDTSQDKLDYEGFLSPIVLVRFAKYMHKNRVQSDGSIRDSDNWQKGIPMREYIKSLMRHFMDFWLLHRGWEPRSGFMMETLLCAILFNAQGYLHELLVAREYNGRRPSGGPNDKTE